MTPTLSIQIVGMQRRRPPKAELALDVELTNDGSEPYWALFPETLAPGARATAGAAWSISAWQLGRPGAQAFVLRASGDAGWYGVLLAASSQVTLKGMPLGWWGEVPQQVELAVDLAQGLTVDGSPLEGRLGLGALHADRAAVVDARAIANPAAISGVISGSPAAPLTVDWTAAGEVLTAAARR